VERLRRDRDREIAGAEREIDALYRALRDAVAQAIEAQPGETLTATGRAAAMAEVDRALEPIYGRFRGDEEAALLQLVVRRQRRARAAAWRRSLAMARERLR
jgi:hypothetical protein